MFVILLLKIKKPQHFSAFSIHSVAVSLETLALLLLDVWFVKLQMVKSSSTNVKLACLRVMGSAGAARCVSSVADTGAMK